MRKVRLRIVQRSLDVLALRQIHHESDALVSVPLENRAGDQNRHAAAVFAKVLFLPRLGSSSRLQLRQGLFVGFTLLVLPGIFLLVCYLVLLPVLLFENFNPYTALVRSVQLMQPHWWKALATIVIAVLILLICTLAAAAVLSIVAALLGGEGSAVQAIVAAVTVGIWAIGCVFLSALALTLHSAASSSA